MPSTKLAVNEVQKAIDGFASGLPEIEKQQFNKVYALLKDLSLDSDGNIKATVENMKVIGRVDRQLQTITDNPQYQNNVAGLKGTIDKLSNIQTDYFAATFSDFDAPSTLDQLQKISFSDAVDSLAGSGINENVISPAIDIVSQGIQEGSSFTKMVDDLKAHLVSDEETDGKLVSYSKQIVNDTLSNFVGNYHQVVAKDLDIEWYRYVGALISTSRPFCIAMEHKEWIHKSELGSCARGIVDGEKVSTAGMMPGTNASNLISRRGGFNCGHQMIPVPSSSVPSKIRREFEPDVTADDDEISDSRPRRQ